MKYTENKVYYNAPSELYCREYEKWYSEKQAKDNLVEWQVRQGYKTFKVTTIIEEV